GVGTLEALFHAAELTVQHLAAKQVLEAFEGVPRRRRTPGVVGQPPDRLRGVGRQRVELSLAQPGFVAGVGEEFRPLLPDGHVKQRACLVKDPVETAPAAPPPPWAGGRDPRGAGRRPRPPAPPPPPPPPPPPGAAGAPPRRAGAAP